MKLGQASRKRLCVNDGTHCRPTQRMLSVSVYLAVVLLSPFFVLPLEAGHYLCQCRTCLVIFLNLLRSYLLVPLPSAVLQCLSSLVG